jgi:hypothetical protein
LARSQRQPTGYWNDLQEFCVEHNIYLSDVTLRYLNLAAKHNGKLTEAAKEIGRSSSAISEALMTVRKRAAKHGFAADLPQHGLTQPGWESRRLSTYVSKDGTRSGWHIQEPEKVQLAQMFEEFCRGVVQSEIEPFPSPTPLTTLSHDPDLLSQIYIGDGHFGMYAWGEETGHEDFNVDIAATDLRNAGKALIDKAPPAKTLVIVNVGDFLHMNDSMNRTFKGTLLDVDTRMARVMRIAANTLRYLVDYAQTKFETVYLINVRGNHDTDIAVGMNLALEFAYEDNPRVVVPENKGFYHWLEWGQWLWGFTHGDKAKHAMLGDVMCRELREAWGRTYHHMWVTGHFHKDQIVTLDNGVKVKICNPLVPPDGWHASMGYGGEQSMELSTYRREGGIHSTYVEHIIRPKQIVHELLQVA